MTRITPNALLQFIINKLKFTPMAAVISITLILLIMSSLSFIFKSPPKILLLDFACYKPAKSLTCTKAKVVELSRRHGNFSEDSQEFIKKTLERSGLGESTYLPEWLQRVPMDMCMKLAREEAEIVMFGAVDDLLAKTGVKGEEIKIVVVNCSIFSPVPSLSSMIVNRYKIGDDVTCYNLSGMGCSAGLMAIGLAKNLLKVRHNSYALVVSTENITQNCYIGNDRPKLVFNCIFRMGGAAILLSNRPSDRRAAKYQLIHTVHTNTANSDCSYNCIVQEEDEEGHLGVTGTKDLIAVAADTIKANLAIVGPLILPAPEQLLYVTNYIIRIFHVAKIKPYVPQFKSAVDHFFPHVGAKPVLDEVERNLKIREKQMEASRMTLYRFGNTSSSSVWYELAYAEAKGRIKRGDSVWQIAFGAGFKCSSAIWKAIRSVDYEEINPWSDEIDEFPVEEAQMGIFPIYFEQSKSMLS